MKYVNLEILSPSLFKILPHIKKKKKGGVFQILKYKNTDLVAEARVIIRACPVDQNGE